MAGYFFAVFFDGSLFSQSYVFQSTFQRFQQSKDPLKHYTTHGFVAKKKKLEVFFAMFFEKCF